MKTADPPKQQVRARIRVRKNPSESRLAAVERAYQKGLEDGRAERRSNDPAPRPMLTYSHPSTRAQEPTVEIERDNFLRTYVVRIRAYSVGSGDCIGAVVHIPSDVIDRGGVDMVRLIAGDSAFRSMCIAGDAVALATELSGALRHSGALVGLIDSAEITDRILQIIGYPSQ